jgi:hypothetical protein
VNLWNCLTFTLFSSRDIKLNFHDEHAGMMSAIFLCFILKLISYTKVLRAMNL